MNYGRRKYDGWYWYAAIGFFLFVAGGLLLEGLGVL